MPLDTPQKRRSMMGFGKYPRFNLPIADGGDMQLETERKHLLYLYSGISSRVLATPAGEVVSIPPSPHSDPVDYNTRPRTIFRPVLIDARLLVDEDNTINVFREYPTAETIFDLTHNLRVFVPQEATTDVTIVVKMRENMSQTTFPWLMLLFGDSTSRIEFFLNDRLGCGAGIREETIIIPKADWNAIVGTQGFMDVQLRDGAKVDNPNGSDVCEEATVQFTVAFSYQEEPEELPDLGGPHHGLASEDETDFNPDGVPATTFGEWQFDPATASFIFMHEQNDIQTRAGWTVVDGAVAVIATGEIVGQIVSYSSGGGCTLRPAGGG